MAHNLLDPARTRTRSQTHLLIRTCYFRHCSLSCLHGMVWLFANQNNSSFPPLTQWAIDHSILYLKSQTLPTKAKPTPHCCWRLMVLCLNSDLFLMSCPPKSQCEIRSAMQMNSSHLPRGWTNCFKKLSGHVLSIGFSALMRKCWFFIFPMSFYPIVKVLTK